MLLIFRMNSIAIIIPVPQVRAFLTIPSKDKSMLFKLITGCPIIMEHINKNIAPNEKRSSKHPLIRLTSKNKTLLSLSGATASIWKIKVTKIKQIDSFGLFNLNALI